MLNICVFHASGLFGNFLGESEKQRIEQLGVQRSTQSIWSYVFLHSAQFTQPQYEAHSGACTWHACMVSALLLWSVILLVSFSCLSTGPLWPQTGMKQMRLWERFFCRWNINSHPAMSGGGSWRDDWCVCTYACMCACTCMLHVA